MTDLSPLQLGMLMACFITACAISFRIGTVWEQHNTRKAIHRAKVIRAIADERIEEAERDLALIKAEREVMCAVAAEWNRILEKVNGHQLTQRTGPRASGEIRAATHPNAGLHLRH